MKKIFGIIALGMFFGLGTAFCAGSFEAISLSEGVNFNNQAEVLAYAETLRKNENVIAQAREEGIHVDIWIRNIIVEMTNNYQEEQRLLLERQNSIKRIEEAETWSSRNVRSGAILLDIGRQQNYLSECDKNSARALQIAYTYVGKNIQFTGEISQIFTGYYGYEITLQLERPDGISVSLKLNIDEIEKALALNIGDIVTVVGLCDSFGHAGNHSYFSMPEFDYVRLSYGIILR